MRRLFLILMLAMLSFAVAQVDHDLRVRVEQAKDKLNDSHTLIWEVGKAITQSGVVLTPEQVAEAKAKYLALIQESIALLQGVELEPVPVAETPVEVPELAEMQATVDRRVYATGGRRERVTADLDLIQGMVAKLEYEGAARIINQLIADGPAVPLFYKSTTSGRIHRNDTLELLNQMKVRLP